jgi:hypothetical protein
MTATRSSTPDSATVSVTGSLRACIAMLAIVAGSSVAYGQPASETEPPPPVPDPLPSVNERLAAQQKLLDELAARDADLAAQLAAERSDRIAATKQTPPTPPAITLGGFIQIDAVGRQSSQDELRQSGDPLNQDRFYIRRARPKLTAIYGPLGGVIEIDINTVNGGQVRPSALEAMYRPTPWLETGIGIAKIPFGFEVVQSDRDRLFLERSNAERALFPGEYDIGARVGGAWKYVRYALAVQNGEPVGEKGFTFRDPNQGKDITTRVGLEATSGNLTIAGGFSFLTGRGFHAGTPATKDALVWRDLNEDGVVNTGEIQVLAGQAATPSASFDRFGLGADVEVSVDLRDAGKLLVYGEVVAAGNLDRATVIADPIAQNRDVRELGYYLAAVHAPNAWSALGARFDLYDPDADASELRTGMVVPVDQRMSTFALTAALRRAHGRLILEYDHNRNHSGRTTTGVPTNLGDDAIGVRAEIDL